MSKWHCMTKKIWEIFFIFVNLRSCVDNTGGQKLILQRAFNQLNYNVPDIRSRILYKKLSQQTWLIVNNYDTRIASRKIQTAQLLSRACKFLVPLIMAAFHSAQETCRPVGYARKNLAQECMTHNQDTCTSRLVHYFCARFLSLCHPYKTSSTVVKYNHLIKFLRRHPVSAFARAVFNDNLITSLLP